MITMSGIEGQFSHKKAQKAHEFFFYAFCAFCELWFDEAVIAVFSFVDNTKPIGVGVAEYQKLIGLA